MKKTLLAVAAVSTLVAAGAALADKTVTFLSSPARTTSMTFNLTYLPDGTVGTVNAIVCAHTRTGSASGPYVEPTCHGTSLAAGNAIRTAVQNLAAGQARDFWLTREGL